YKKSTMNRQSIVDTLAGSVPINPSDVLNNMKAGSLLMKCKPHGTKYPRQFYLYNSEDILSYQESKKVFSKPKKYPINEIDEVRCGYQSNTFEKLLRQKSLKHDDVRR
ncbi:unnamed protein product, partial [Didymodactylos carnosus]